MGKGTFMLLETTKLTLAILLLLTSAFENGLKSFQAEKYPQAITEFTRVIEQKAPHTEILEFSLYYRAVSYAALKDTEKAVADVRRLLTVGKNNDLRDKALSLFDKLGGDRKKLLPEETPKETMNGVLETLTNKDEKKFKTFISGHLLWLYQVTSTIQQAENAQRKRNRTFMDELAGELRDAAYISYKIDPKSMTASLTVSINRGRVTLEFGLTPVDGRWTFNTVKDFRFQQRNIHHHAAIEHRAMAEVQVQIAGKENRSNLDAIHTALELWAADNESKTMPSKLELITPKYLTNKNALLWNHPKNQKKENFLYHANVKLTEEKRFLLAAPKPIQGKRLVMYVDGSVKELDNADFLKEASKQKWKIPGTLKKEDVAKATRTQIKTLIKQLGDQNFKVRTSASEKLRKIGAPAHPFLKELLQSDDPQIRLTAEELLK